jgi:hypothetical protein
LLIWRDGVMKFYVSSFVVKFFLDLIDWPNVILIFKKYFLSYSQSIHHWETKIPWRYRHPGVKDKYVKIFAGKSTHKMDLVLYFLPNDLRVVLTEEL